MRLLSRYLLRELAAPFLFSLGALTSMLLLNQIAKRFGDLVGKGLSGEVIAEVLLLSLPFIVALTLPMAVLVAVLYGFSHLAADSEITAMRASGISVGQMLRPVLVAGVLIAVLNFLFLDQVLPRSNARLRNLQLDIGRTTPTLTMREQAINPLPPENKYHIRASRIEAGTGRMRNITIFDLSQPASRRIVYGDSGVMAFEANGTDLRLHLFDGAVHEYRPDEAGTIRVTRYDQNIIRARGVSTTFERREAEFDRGDREMSTCEMIDEEVLAREKARRWLAVRQQYTRQDVRSLLRLVPQAEQTYEDPVQRQHCGPWRDVERFLGRYIFPEPAEAQVPVASGGADSLPVLPVPAIGTEVAVVNLSNLSGVSEARANQGREVRAANSFAVEIHKKFTISIACFNFVLIGIALALRFPRGGMGLVLGGSLLIFTVFYISMTAGEQLADRGFLAPAAGMWAPNVLIGALGLLGLRAASRATGTARGGDLADLVDVLFGWLRRKRR
ncbi:MAG TPA: LptF/LptG family permease, partial [Gemmatimonadales bacterium]|nr:LptF/LptG family permease [Gemmatimonadales bacterium]